MKHCILTVIFVVCSFCASAQNKQTNHVDLTTTIIEFLSRTELCLNACQDAASVQAAIPQLQELKKECDSIVETQKALPEPTVQDYMAVQQHMEAFSTVWTAICNHIERLEEAGLMTPEMRKILFIAPPKQ